MNQPCYWFASTVKHLYHIQVLSDLILQNDMRVQASMTCAVYTLSIRSMPAVGVTAGHMLLIVCISVCHNMGDVCKQQLVLSPCLASAQGWP